MFLFLSHFEALEQNFHSYTPYMRDQFGSRNFVWRASSSDV